MPRRLGALLLLICLLTGCTGDATPSPASPPVVPTPTLAATGLLEGPTPAGTPDPAGVAAPLLVSSDLVVGPNRFVFGLVDRGTGQPIPDVPQVSLQFFTVHADGTATKIGDADVVYHKENLPVGLFVSHMTFTEAGTWGALFTVERPGLPLYQARLNFTVQARSAIPQVGDSAIPSQNLTIRDVEKISDIDSAQPHDTMHTLTIAQAVRSGKPSLILFATPGFCESRMCGPDLDVALALQRQYGDRANFIHIETPSHTHPGVVAPDHYTSGTHPGVARPQIQTMQEWGLKTEPWIFLLDRDGRVAARFEGGLTFDEVAPAFALLFP
jgi:hypothetical protein